MQDYSQGKNTAAELSQSQMKPLAEGDIARVVAAALSQIQAQTKPAAQKSRKGKKAVMAHMEPAVAWQLRKLALDRQTTVQQLLEEAVADLFVKHHVISV